MKQQQVSASNETSITSDALSEFHDNETISTKQSSLNFSSGVSAECLTALVGNQQLMEAREKSKGRRLMVKTSQPDSRQQKESLQDSSGKNAQIVLERRYLKFARRNIKERKS